MDAVRQKKIILISVFAIAFAFVESSVVVYLRALYYPEGFSFPLKEMPLHHLAVELAREFSTLVMLAAAGMMAGESRWGKFSFFLIAFGVWDIFYYGWLKVLLDWPKTLGEWDILFLIPVPWIGPVIAPVLVSLLFIIAGLHILRNEARFRPSFLSWILAVLGSGSILFSFIRDTDATLRLQIPQPYQYAWLAAGLGAYGVSLFLAVGLRTKR